jgi:hypothetical protein
MNKKSELNKKIDSKKQIEVAPTTNRFSRVGHIKFVNA